MTVSRPRSIRTALFGLVSLLCSSCTSINLAPDVLEGTSWRIAAVNGKTTPATGDYSMRFDADGGVGARFGCNHMGGKYRIAGDTLTVSNVATTLMGCAEPAGTFESEGSAILSRPMRVSFPGNERMGLSNEAGSIALGRAR
jgi:heat shock protein HslJ